MKLLDLLMEPTKAMRRLSPLVEDLTEGQENELLFMYNRVREGEHRARVRDERTYATADPVVREAYSQDSVRLPGPADALVKRTPGAVVMPGDRGEVLELVRFAQRTAVPIVPRGGGTSVHGGAVPIEGGVVADMRAMDEVLEVDGDAGTVRVEAGITWLDLDEALAQEGLAVASMPVTAPTSTVAGAIAMDKAGFGSYANGSVSDNLVEVELMTPDHESVTMRGEDLELVVGCQGASGVILEATLKVVERHEQTTVGAAFDTIDEAERFVRSLPSDGIDTVQIWGAQHVGLILEAQEAPRALPKKKSLVLVTLDAARAEELVPDLEARCQAGDAEWVDEETAAWAIERRFMHRCYQRFGPSLLVAEASVPKEKLAEAWWAAMDAMEAPEYTLWAIATGPESYMLVASILCDERLPSYPLAWGNRLAFLDAVKDEGGQATAPGLLTPGEAKPVLGSSTVQRLAAWRSERDDGDIMNPGKILPARVRGSPLPPRIKSFPLVATNAAVIPGVAVMKSMRGQFEHRRGSTTEPSNRALQTVMGRRHSTRLAELGDELVRCSRLGLTNRVGGLHRGIEFLKEQPRAILRAHRFDTQLPRGIVAAGRALLSGTEPTPQLVSHALSLPAVPTYENASQNDTPILEAIEAVREAAQKSAGLDKRVRDVVEALEADGNVLGQDGDARGEWMPGGAPSGVDTTTLFVAGDVAAYERTRDAQAIFNTFTNAGFGFTTLGPNEVHPGTVPYRLGAFDAAADAAQQLAAAARDHMEEPPKTLVTASSEDADVLRRRLDDLVTGSEHADWRPRVMTATEALADLVGSNRLSFPADEEGEPPEAAQGQEASEEESAEDEQEEGSDSPDQEDLAESDEAPAEEDEAPPSGLEELEVKLVHSPFATDEERQALETLADAIPALEHETAPLDDVLVPDVAYALVNPAQTDALGMEVKKAVAGTALVGCTDLAHVLDEIGVNVETVHELVAQRMEVREGGGVTVEVPEEEEEEGFQEFEIPEGAHRVELVKEEAAIPVFPDESILDAAERQGFEDMPFDCRAGSCVTCCARWEGAAPDQSEAQAISEDEQETHVLTCVARPTGDVKIWSGEQP